MLEVTTTTEIEFLIVFAKVIDIRRYYEDYFESITTFNTKANTNKMTLVFCQHN